jgi:hypothetical protein
MKYRRRKYIINAGFQWRFVLGFIGAVFVDCGFGFGYK